MAKCRKCGQESYYGYKWCDSCKAEWWLMRHTIFDFLAKKHGKVSPTNHLMFSAELKQLERQWKKDKQKVLDMINRYPNGLNLAGNHVQK